MAFRDEQIAEREKVAALEREVERLRAENAELRAGREPPRTPSTIRGGRWVAAGAFGVALVAALLVARLPIPALILPAILATLLSTTVGVSVLVLSQVLHVVRPDEVLVLAGRRHLWPDAQYRGYRCVTGGRVMRVPLLETAHVLDRRPFTIERTFDGLPARDGATLSLRLRYEARITHDEDRLPQAVERFLEADPAAVRRTVTEAVEAAARQRASASRPEQLERPDDRDAAAEHIEAEAGYLLSDTGLDLTALTVLEVS